MLSMYTVSPGRNGGSRSSVADCESPCSGHQRQARRALRRHRPTDDTSTENVENDGKEQKSRPSRHVRDVRDPQLIETCCGKLAIDQVRDGAGILVSNRRFEALSPRCTLDIALSHRSCYALVTCIDPLIAKICLNARTAVGFIRGAVERNDAITKHEIRLTAV